VRLASILALLLTLAAAQTTRSEPVRRLTLPEAERLALEGNPSLLSMKSRAQAGELLARAGISRMLPSIVLTDDYQHWDRAFPFPFSAPGVPAGNVREQDTNTFAASLNQPLLGLLRLVEERRALVKSAAATASQLAAAQEAVRHGVRVAFIRHFEALALAEIARQSEKELAEQVAIAQAKLKAGVLTNADVLRIQVAAANARQQEVNARTQAAIAAGGILISIGMEPDAAVELVAPEALLQAAREEPAGYSALVARALRTRPELLTARLSVEAAEHQQRGRLYALLPEVNIQAGYTHIDGQVFAPRDSGFIGIKATWLLWDWGATWFGFRAARAQTEASRQELLAQKRQISGEVATELAQAGAARHAVRLAEQAIESAQEAYRVTDALLKAGSATTTDLLEAQGALNQARLNLVRAQYQLALAHVSVEHAAGMP